MAGTTPDPTQLVRSGAETWGAYMLRLYQFATTLGATPGEALIFAVLMTLNERPVPSP